MSKPVLFRVTNNLNLGGVQKRLRALLPLLTRDFQVHVVVYRDRGPLFQELSDQGVHTHFLHRGGTWDPLFIKRLAALLGRHKADILHTHSFGANVPGILAGALARTPVRIAQVHLCELHWPARSRWKKRKQAMEESLIHRLFTQRILFVSRQSMHHFKKQTRLPERMLTLLHNGVEFPESRISQQQARLELGLDPDRTWIGFVGRLSTGKGVDLFLDLARQVLAADKSFGFVLAGGGSSLDKWRSYAAQQGLSDRVVFLGEQQDVARCYRALDLLIFPSEPWAEGMPGVVLEAAGLGLPILARRSPALEEIASYYGGIAFLDGFDSPLKGIRATLSAPLADPDSLRAEFSLEAMRRRTVDLYGSLRSA